MCCRADQGWVMVAVTCTAEDEAEADLWREDRDSGGAADRGGAPMMLGEPALHQTVQVRRCGQVAYAPPLRVSGLMLRASSLTSHIALVQTLIWGTCYWLQTKAGMRLSQLWGFAVCSDQYSRITRLTAR
jgi:hypothetical protein